MDLYVDESFKKTYGDPFLSHRFVVEIGGVIAASFSQFSGIKMQVQTIQARSGSDIRGVQDYVPVLTTYEPATLTKGVVHGSAILDWLDATSAGKFAGPSGKPLRRTIDIISLDEAGNRGVVWTLYHAMPIAYELSPMDASRSEVLAESITFAYTAMDREFQEIKILNTFTRKPHKKVKNPPALIPETEAPKTSKHKKDTKVTPKPVPKDTHKKVTRVTPKPVPKDTHKKVTKVTPKPVPKDTHKKATKVTPKPVPKNSHSRVTRGT